MLPRDLVNAFMLLTRLPVARFVGPDAAPDLGRCIWAFPVVGAAVNGTGGLVDWLAHRAGMPPLLGAALALVVMLLLTGALHEDGLADTADGFGGGGTPACKLDIMRDSRIGSYGALALGLSSLVRVAALASIGDPGTAVRALILAGVIGRGGMGLLPLLLSPARSGGMGAALGAPRPMSATAGAGLASAVSLLLLDPRPALVTLVLAAGSALAVAKLARAQVGGYTGDVLGAAEVVGECVVLSVLASSLSS